MTQGAREIIARADGGHWRFFIQSVNNMIVVEVVQDSIIGSLKSKTVMCIRILLRKYRGAVLSLYMVLLNSVFPIQ
jgi:hypothetical protein